ncbi:MAG: site-specific DNA-methyltransferase [Patescibacteria group bacterium]
MTTENSPSLDGASLDVAADNRARLRTLFPSCFTETRDEKGNLVESLDFERLKAELGTFTDLFEARRERYGVDWPGKKDALKLIQTPTYATLKPAKDQSVDWDSTENVFIEGDNLETLKLLQKSYYGKVKMIYIDPPYNTGKEFIYPDNFSESLETYLAYAGLADDEGKKFSTNTASEGRFHTKWLNMMYPRLYLARNLLSQDGVIFITIDDSEVENLKRLCNEIFGEENFVACIVWQKTYSPANDKKGVDAMHDYVLCYQKSDLFNVNLFPRTAKQDDAYTNLDNDPRGPWKSVDATRAEYREYAWFPITTPSGKEVYPAQGRSWVFTKEELPSLLADNRLWFGKDGSSKPSKKLFLTEVKQGVTPTTWWSHEDAGHNDEAKKELKALLTTGIPFDTPKPTRLIERLLQLGTNRETADVVLDFFAGSGTTAHAVLSMNQKDNGNRQFILVQLPEPTEQPEFPTISHMAKERIRKFIAKTKDTSGHLQAADLGFRAFMLDKSNFRRWQKLGADATADQIAEQLELHVEHVDPSASQEDLLFEILLKAGFRPTEKAELVEMAGLPVYSIAGGALLICLADRVTKELVDAVAEAEPMHFFCLDSAFGGNDQLKANAVQTFAARNQGREKASQIVFRTV